MMKKLKLLLVFISLSVTLCLMSNTYSRYVADTTNNIEVLFAKWQILVNNTDVTNNTTSEITFEPTIEENANVASNKIAPTSKGYFDIDIDPTNVDVSFKYTINLNIENENIPDLMITKYSIIPNDYIEGTTLEQFDLKSNSISNTLNYDNKTNSFQFEKFTVRVYFEWYEGKDEAMNDNEDTKVGNKAVTENTTFTINSSINFEQVIN